MEYESFEVADRGRIALVRREAREPGAKEVRIAVEACGVCHSDVLAVGGVRPDTVGITPGHEIVGRITAVGDSVEHWKIGDRVGVGYLEGACGACDSCRDGDPVGCVDQPETGVSVDGGYAEVAYARESALVHLPEGVDAVALAPLLCAGLTTFQALREANPRPGGVVAVQGLGGLGHLAVQYAARMEYRTAVIARGPDKRALAEQLGAEFYVDSNAGDVGEALRALGSVEAIVATAASGASMSPLTAGLGQRGTLVVVGAAPDPIQVGTADLVFGRRRIVGSLTGTPRDADRAIAFSVANGVAAWTEEFALADAQAAYEHMMSGAARFRAVLRMPEPERFGRG